MVNREKLQHCGSQVQRGGSCAFFSASPMAGGELPEFLISFAEIISFDLMVQSERRSCHKSDM